jgi:hypothetical protein
VQECGNCSSSRFVCLFQGWIFEGRWQINTAPTCMFLSLTSQLTHSTVRLEKLIVAHVVKTFISCYGPRRFITVFTRARNRPLSWPRWIQSTPSHPVSLRCIVILSYHLCLCRPSGLFLSVLFCRISFVLLYFIVNLSVQLFCLHGDMYAVLSSGNL